ncbi:MAG: transglycosylase domain-containing protein, partial [[Eubacterium] siraeum]|nr:transglycosylase domain-containing protein [[Eubacterium] siraeum]
LILLPLFVIACTVGGFAIWANTQKIDASLLPTATAVPTFYDRDGNELPYADSNYVDINLVSDDLKYAFVALEDKRFYKHNGYDLTRMIGAMLNNIKAGSVREGASTITQQLVKNTHLSHERTLSRKLKELALAINLEKQYSKDEILAMYLSVIYFGSGAYGVKQAADLYFDKNIEDLTLAECATLAGIIKNPSKYSPTKNPDESIKRRNVVLNVMRAEGYINDEEAEAAKSQPLTVANAQDEAQNDAPLNAKACEYYISQAAKEVCDALNITKYQLSNSGLKIYTHLDARLQADLEKMRHSDDNFESDGIGNVSIVIDNENCAVLAHSSSYPYTVSRQAGSVLKPLAIYAPALDKNLITLATPIIDEKIDFNGFSPDNYAGIYYGDTTVREAIKKSMNSVSVKVLDYLGSEDSARYLDSFGISIDDSDKNYALALGATAKGVTPVSIASAYASLARGGEYTSPSYVRFAVDGGNKILSNERTSPSNTQVSHQVLAKSTASLITSALLDTVKDGTAKTLGALSFEVASKTGTVERASGGNSDAWNASYNDRFTVLVWHGSDEDMSEKGGGYPTRHALKIWQAISQKNAISDKLSLSGGVISADVDIYSTKLNREVVLASENTPLEYRKSEYFSLNNLPTANGSKFDKISEIDLEVSNKQGVVTLNFRSENIYEYEVYRQDVLGSNLIYSDSGNDDSITVVDRPIAFDGKVDYTLICRLKNNEEISSSISKSVYIDSSLSEWSIDVL